MPLDFRYMVATDTQRPGLISLRAQIFSRDVGQVPDDGLDDTACHLIALDATGEIVAGFRVLGPEFRPFEFEDSLSLDSLAADGGVPAMIGRLWVRPDYRVIMKSIRLHRGLLGFALETGIRLGFSDYFLITYPRLLSFYRAASFVDTGITHLHPSWGRVHIMRRVISQRGLGRVQS